MVKAAQIGETTGFTNRAGRAAHQIKADPTARPSAHDGTIERLVIGFQTGSAVHLAAGDVVRFERKTPFGTAKWEKKKSELTDDERRILAQQNAKPADAPEAPAKSQ